jgi:N-dimethylarginine dimethylaminohydrolase
MSTARIELTTKVLSNKPYLVTPRATFLMCPPTLYDVDYVINPWMAGNVHASSRTRAAEQWQRLYEAVSKIATVELVEPEPGSPDMVFTANAGLERNGIVAISSFFHPERQGEEPWFRRWFRQAGYTIVDISRATPFEGEGDALFSTDGRCLWIGHGPRTALSSHHMLREIWDIPVVPLHLIDPRFYHLDTCFAPLEGGYAMYFPEAFDHLSLHRIEAFYPPEKRIIVRETDAVCFACNAINVDRTVIFNRISSKLSGQLEQLGFKVIQVELTEFLKAGGAAKCLVMKLSPPTSQP